MQTCIWPCPLPLTVSCFSKIQIGFTFLVPAHPGSPGKRAVKRVCVCVLVVCETVLTYECITDSSTHFSTIQQVILTLCVHKCCRCLVPTLWHVWNCHLLSQTFWDQSKPVRNSKNNWTCYNWSNSLQRKGQLHHVLRKEYHVHFNGYLQVSLH